MNGLHAYFNISNCFVSLKKKTMITCSSDTFNFKVRLLQNTCVQYVHSLVYTDGLFLNR